MEIYKGFNLLPKIKKSQASKIANRSGLQLIPKKRLFLYTIWTGVLFVLVLANYLVLSYTKIELARLTKAKNQLVASLEQDKEKYLLYHNISFRQLIIQKIQQQKYRPSILIDQIDAIIPPSKARQYMLDREGTVSLGLTSKDFVNAAITWRRLILNKDIFVNLELRNFSLTEEGYVPFVLKGQLNIPKILEKYSVQK